MVDQEVAIAELMLSRQAAEIELLATITDSPRRSIIIIKSCGVLPSHFSADDTFAIFHSIEDAALNAWTKQQMFDRAMYFLRALKLWDEKNFGPVTNSCRWGPGPLAALICRTPFNEKLIVERSARLLKLVESEESL